MATSSSPTSSEHPALRPIACLRCRNRRSYCSKEKPRCSRCQLGNYECVYEESRKIPVNERYLRDLEAKAKAYDEFVARQRASGSAAAGISSEGKNVPEEKDDGLDDDHVLLEPFTELSIHSPSTTFKGPGAADNFLQTVRNITGIYGDDGSLDLNTVFYDTEALKTSRREGVTDRIRLPPPDVARRLFAAHHTYIGTIFAFTDPDRFDRELTTAYRGPPDPEDKEACLTYAKVLIVLAFGQLYSVNQWIDFKGPPGFDYFAHALKLLPDPHEEGSILCVETLALAGYFMQNMNRRDAAFLYIGMALRMAISLGLHQEVTSLASTAQSSNPIIGEAMLERRRRVWWSIYSLDRIISVKSGNPLTIQDEDIGVALPSRLPSEGAYCQAVVVRQYTELSRILSEITKAVYRKSSHAPKSGKRLMASVQSIILALSKWNRDLPEELRFDPAKLSISRESTSTFGHYYQCINMVARPLLYHVVQKRLKEIRKDPAAKEREWTDGLSKTTVRVIELCISAAQDTISMFTVAAQRDLVATYGYMDTEHVFSAEIVLVMACIAFPANESNDAAMKRGLDLLRNMSQRGNSQMAARYEMLEHLLSVVAPGSTALNPSTEPLNPFPSAFESAVPARFHSPHTAELVAAQAAMPPSFIPSPVMTMGAGDDQDQPGTSMSGGKDYTPFGMQAFPVEGGPSSEPFFDENAAGGMDFMLWEEGFANPIFDAGFDITQWTQEVQMDMRSEGNV